MYRGWIVGLLVLIVVVAIGAATVNNAYQAGLAQGLAQSAPPDQARPMPYYYGPWGYGWGHGFGFFGFFGFLLFLFLILGLIRALFFWGRGGPGYWHRGPGGAPPWFEEWHRRVHDEKPGTTRGTTV